MKLKRAVDAKNVIGILFSLLFISLVINLINLKYKLGLNIILILAIIIYSSIFERRIYFENSYLYIKRRNVKERPNSLKDNHIKLSDILGYSLNNPFLQLSDFCLSEKNITLYLKNSKPICFAVNEQEEIIKTLQENNISQQIPDKPKGLVKLIIVTVLSLAISVFYFIAMKKNQMKDSILVFTLSVLISVYFLYKLIYGIAVFCYKKNPR